jgi:hypothetical protein
MPGVRGGAFTMGINKDKALRKLGKRPFSNTLLLKSDTRFVQRTPDHVSDAFFGALKELFGDRDWHDSCLSLCGILFDNILLIIVIRSIKVIQ